MVKKKEKKNNKNLIIGICAAVVIVAVIVVAIVLGINNGTLSGINDGYFKSDGSKYVLTMDANDISNDDSEHVPVKTHFVYYYSGDNITGLKAFYEYDSVENAEAAYNYFVENENDSYKNISRDGKYVVLEANESEYEGVTASDVKQQVEFMEAIRSLNTGSENEGTEETSEPTTEQDETAETVEE